MPVRYYNSRDQIKSNHYTYNIPNMQAQAVLLIDFSIEHSPSSVSFKDKQTMADEVTCMHLNMLRKARLL